MTEIHTESEIDAPPEIVWEQLIQFRDYPEWNPFIRKVEGSPTPGERLTVRMEPPEGTGMTFRPVVLAAVAPSELRWKGRLPIPGVFDGEHSFHLEAIHPSGTRFVQKEVFSGLLVPLFAKILRRTKNGFTLMNQALKMRAEERVTTGLR
jgi:hypothetical protein